jgi:hypothetical protein
MDARFFVMYTVEGLPPRALVEQTAVWTEDVGAWCIDGTPVNAELGAAITERARALGVEGVGVDETV